LYSDVLLKTAPSGLRRRVVAAAAAFSASVAVYCLGVAAASGAAGPVCGFAAGVIATAALVRAARGSGPDPGPLRLCPHRGVLAEGDGEAPLRAIGVTRNVICLARPGGWGHRPIWRDGVAPDGFRRIAAFSLWRRGSGTDPADGAELIAREAVTEGRSVPRTGRPRDQ
jgi:hypothetical protein